MSTKQRPFCTMTSSNENAAQVTIAPLNRFEQRKENENEPKRKPYNFEKVAYLVPVMCDRCVTCAIPRPFFVCEQIL